MYLKQKTDIILIMGIPSFFSHIVKNNPEIIKKLHKLKKNVDNIYLDSNSIIYDCLRNILSQKKEMNDKELEKILCEKICLKLDDYILEIKPQKTVFIAFDGVAPVAKLDQQRNRRYKSVLEEKILKKLDPDRKKKWNKTAITPGTKFMKNLNNIIKNYYSKKKTDYEIIISGSDEIGEGEHKIFEYIRNTPKKHKHEVTLIYGLDADLIMLCLNHLPISKNIYLYRETPEFIKSINRNLNPNENYILDIPELSREIISKMNNGFAYKNDSQQKNRLYDYILICFFLGNDFLPHFPAINIRTTGIHKMMNAYRNTIGKSNTNLTDGKKINWKNLHILIDYLQKDEWKNIMEEYKILKKWGRRSYSFKTLDDKMDRYLNIPSKNRDIENYINPEESNWQKRYYNILFNSNESKSLKKKISMNYLEGLEWVMNYYTTGCKDWRWSYNYNYPPLLEDLIKYVPMWDMEMLEKKECNPVTPTVQLAYVLPKESSYLLEKDITDKLNNINHYKENCNIYWAYCRYFWESHVDLPHIDLDKLETLIN
jgi:5'-3' exoribonuclease 1